MIFQETRIPGVFVIETEVFADDRGTFSAPWVAGALARHGLETGVAQLSLVTNARKNTLRGLHYQTAPVEEVKCVRVLRGGVFDVAVDIRPDSPTFRQWVGVELSAENRRMLYVPRGFAHGYQTLTDGAEVAYLVSAAYSPEHQRGARWDDPAFGIEWPLGPPAIIHPRDAAYPDVRA
jgi:dTDP-4-dehydrorhamnose 3,5-epimerase